MKLGVLVKDLGASQLNYFLVRNANRALLREPLLDVTAFFQDQSAHCLGANFAAMPLYEAWSFGGMAVATTFETARKLAVFPAPRQRAFYLWDLEWLRPSVRRTYREWASVYRDHGLRLLVRSEEHARVVESAWNRPVHAVVEDFDMRHLLAALCEEGGLP